MIVRAFEPSDEPSVIELWRRCDLTRPWNDPNKDIARKLKVRPDLFLIGDIDGAIVATAMVGYDGHRGWINYLGVDPDHRRKGLAKQIMSEAERLLRAEGCSKINLQVRSSNSQAIEFYREIGFAVDDVVSMGKRLESDEK